MVWNHGWGRWHQDLLGGSLRAPQPLGAPLRQELYRELGLLPREQGRQEGPVATAPGRVCTGRSLSLGPELQLTLARAQARKEGFLVLGLVLFHTQYISG